MIGFDIDGVIADSSKCFKRVLLERFNYDISTSNKSFNFTIPNVEEKDIREAVDYCIDQIDETEIFPNVIEALQDIQTLTNYPIQFVTARPHINKEVTEQWLTKHLNNSFIKWDVHYVKSSEKAEWLYNNCFSAFVEDRLKTANEVASILPISYLVNRSYNQNRDIKSSVVRVNNLLDVAKHFKENQYGFVCD